jgi:hypothetical protein
VFYFETEAPHGTIHVDKEPFRNILVVKELKPMNSISGINNPREFAKNPGLPA